MLHHGDMNSLQFYQHDTNIRAKTLLPCILNSSQRKVIVSFSVLYLLYLFNLFFQLANITD